MYDCVCFIAPISRDYCVELSLVDKTFCENCLHFIMKWFQPDIGEMCFLEESYVKIKTKKSWDRALFKIREYALNEENRQNMLININFRLMAYVVFYCCVVYIIY